MRNLPVIIADVAIVILIGIIAWPMLAIYAVTYRPPPKVLDTFNVETTVSMEVDGKPMSNKRVSHCIREEVYGTIDSGGGRGVGSREEPFENQFFLVDDGSLIVINGLGSCAIWRGGRPTPDVVYSIVPYVYKGPIAGPKMTETERGTIAKVSWLDSAKAPRRVVTMDLATLAEGDEPRVRNLVITQQLTQMSLP
jgi:hypothetical protein